MKAIVDIETGTRLVDDPNGELVEVKDIWGRSRMERKSEVWGYVIWSDDYSEVLHGEYGFESDGDAHDAAASWMNDAYGAGNWFC